jgi:hypothetical protein
MSQTDKSIEPVTEYEHRPLRVTGSGGYCMVNPRRLSRKSIPVQALPAPAEILPIVAELVEELPSEWLETDPTLVDAPVVTEEVDEVFASFERDLENCRVTEELAALPFTSDAALDAEPAVEGAAVAPFTGKSVVHYRDPDLCSCSTMMQALTAKSVIVILDGPVTLPPAVFTETAKLGDGLDALMSGRTYDGKELAFRYCLDEAGHLIDDQVPEAERLMRAVDEGRGVICCATMDKAIQLCRVELPVGDRLACALPKILIEDKPPTHFSTCPWCAANMIELAIARYKGHSATRDPLEVADLPVTPRTRTLRGV